MELGTKQAAKLLRIPPNFLQRLVWEGKLAEPARGKGGRFVWNIESLEKACWQIHRRTLAEFTAGGEK